MAQSQRSGAVQALAQLTQTGALHGEPGQGVLHNGVLNLVLTQLVAESGIFRHSDALIVDQDAGGGVLQLLGQLGHNGLLRFQNFCVGHLGFTSRE